MEVSKSWKSVKALDVLPSVIPYAREYLERKRIDWKITIHTPQCFLHLKSINGPKNMVTAPRSQALFPG